MVCSSCFSSFACAVTLNDKAALTAAAVTRFFAFISFFLTIGFQYCSKLIAHRHKKTAKKEFLAIRMSGRTRQASARRLVGSDQFQDFRLKCILRTVNGSDRLSERLLLEFFFN